jgi:molybdopterin/thiamine biosynthesis adenylyltransferase
MSWWISDPDRASRERIEIANLAESVGWLQTPEWTHTKGLNLKVNFGIELPTKLVPLSLVFPSFYPYLPPQVIPQEEVRVSGHQYGTGGELCLEIRSDNWRPEMNGAMMIESAHRLLAGEESQSLRSDPLPDAHRVTVAQSARGRSFRLLLPHDLKALLPEIMSDTCDELLIQEHYYAGFWVAYPKRIGPEDSPKWSGTGWIRKVYDRNGFAFRVPNEFELIDCPTFDSVSTFARSLGNEDIDRALTEFDRETFFLLHNDQETKLLVLTQSKEKQSLYGYHTINLPENRQNRLSQEYSELQEKSVAIMGCGSVGSKIAASLTRSGIGRIVLVDGDMLFPGNLVRNELDLRSIGLNKPDATEERLLEINPNIKIVKRRVLLGGQESSAATEAALASISRCNLIVEATADPQVFALCAAVSRLQKVPMVWGEVFGGGIGGLLARARPDQDPTPISARDQISNWCSDFCVPWDVSAAGQYDITRDDAPPLIADDSDVSVIAAHLARLAIDILLNQESIFPSSAYVIGLKPEWVFGAPFEAYPIDLKKEDQWGTPESESTSESLKQFLWDAFEIKLD